MYKTMKLRIRADKEMKKLLLQYEEQYHRALRRCVHQMLLAACDCHFKDCAISQTIAQHSRWQLYQQALKYYHSVQQHQDWKFHKSSIWNARDLKLQEQKVTVFFGSRFCVTELVLPLACESIEWQTLQAGTLCRMDIVHDAHYWFANFLIQIKEGCNSS